MNELEKFKLPEDCMEHEWALQAADDVAKYTIKTIKAAPAVDAVPVVRCKDCKWHDEAFYVCSKCGVCVNFDFFCADGALKDGDADAAD